MTSSSSHSFIYGRPVQPGEFLNRDSELGTIFDRLRNGESTAIVGEPKIGKTSLLLKLANKATQRAYLGDDAQHLVISFVDLHPVSNDYAPADFWEEVLEPLRKRPGRKSQRLKDATDEAYTRRSLEKLFEYLGRKKRRLVLLLDEFERLLTHSNFQDPAFFALLRSLSTRTGGLALVTASQFSIEEMNEQGRDLLKTGSPFFNSMIAMRLKPFDEDNVNILLGRARDAFSLHDQRFIRRVAGCQPFLLQAMAATLVGTTGDDDRQARAAEAFYNRVSSHFNDLWERLDNRTRTTAVILSLVELKGWASGQSFSFGEIENADAFEPELRKLADLGLAERVGEGWKFDRKHLLLWRGGQWTMQTQAFIWWVRDVIIAQTRTLPTYDAWLTNKCYRFLLTREQWDWLIRKVQDIPEWAVRGVAALARVLFDELLKDTER